MTQINPIDWENFLAKYPDAHVLQSNPWGKLKSEFAWEASYVISKVAGVQILFRKLPLGFRIAYIPKGPVGKNWTDLWAQTDQLCREKKAIFLRVEPDIWEDQALDVGQIFDGFIGDCPCIQPRRTIVVDLRNSEDEILARMKQKTRYNIHLAEKKDVKVEESDDVDAFYNLMINTGERDQFGIHAKKYYTRALELFGKDGSGRLFLASYQNLPIAGIIVFRRGKRTWYFYGASGELERNRMPTYLLQWEAMRWAKKNGCTEYDLWGVPDENLDTLEANFETRMDGLWKVYRFKRGFGGELKRSAGAWDKVYQPMLYKLYSWWISHRGGLS